MKKAIIFDLDGTLWNTSKEVEQIWKVVAQNYNIKVDEDTIKKIMGYTKNEIIAKEMNLLQNVKKKKTNI